MALLTPEQILAADDLPKRTVKVPEWGGEVIIATMTGESRDAWEQSLLKSRASGVEVDTRNARARLFAFCAINEKGERMFTDAQVEQLGKKSSRALERCAKVAQELNGLTTKDVEEAKGN